MHNYLYGKYWLNYRSRSSYACIRDTYEDYRVRNPKSRKSAFKVDMSFTPLLNPLNFSRTSVRDAWFANFKIDVLLAVLEGKLYGKFRPLLCRASRFLFLAQCSWKRRFSKRNFTCLPKSTCNRVFKMAFINTRLTPCCFFFTVTPLPIYLFIKLA